MNRKESIRTNMRARRAALTSAAIRRAGARIQRAVVKLPEWAAAQRVCVYLALPAEVQTRRLLTACRKTGKRVLVPAYRKKISRYDLAWLRPGDPLKAGPWSVPEPARPRWASARARADFAVIPGVAFDRAGGRVGHGRGHYDRLLAGKALRSAFKAGLALECQIVARAPMNARDIRMDAVATERAVYRRTTDAGRQMTKDGGTRLSRPTQDAKKVGLHSLCGRQVLPERYTQT